MKFGLDSKNVMKRKKISVQSKQWNKKTIVVIFFTYSVHEPHSHILYTINYIVYNFNLKKNDKKQNPFFKYL